MPQIRLTVMVYNPMCVVGSAEERVWECVHEYIKAARSCVVGGCQAVVVSMLGK